MRLWSIPGGQKTLWKSFGLQYVRSSTALSICMLQRTAPSEVMSLRKPFSEEDTGPLLTLGDRVVWLFEHGPEHGWVRWIGRIPVVSPNWTIGVEFDNPIGAGDGKFGGKRYFYARNDHAYFLPNSSLLRACDYNSSFRKQNSLGGSTPGFQAKMYTFPHQYSVAKCPFKHQLQAGKVLPDEPRPSGSELPVVETKNKTSGGRKEGGGGGRVGETASSAAVAATAACSLEMMAGKASPVSLPQASTHASAHTSSGRQRPPVHPNSPTALMQAKLPALFRQLEEAISKGEHDRAAILARELAMYKVSCSLRRVRKVAPDPKQFIVKMYVEDRKSHVGPISLPVHPEMTVSNLKKKVETEYNIPARVQRWILGKNLATDDGATLEHFGVSHSACPVFLYLVSPAEELRAEEVIRNRCWKPPDSIASTEEGEELANTIARNDTSDASSTLDALLNDRAAGWTCQLCGINNTEPDTCAMCGVAVVVDATDHADMDASRPSVDADHNVEAALGYKTEPTEVHDLVHDQLEASNSRAEVDFTLNQEDVSHGEEPEQVPPPQTLLPQDYMRLVELDEQDLVPSMEAFECSVCFLGIEPGQGVLLRDCLHMFCRDCLSNSVRYAEEAMVKCPFRNNEYSCSSHLQEREIRALVSPEVYEHHLSRSVKTAESQAPNSFHCKTADCPGWCMLEDNVNTFMCPVCGHSNCLTCRAIHEGKNCLQYQDELDFNAPDGQEAKQTKEYLDNMVKEGQAMHCPQCRVIVMKKWGCDWLKCSVCQTEICWVTKGPRWGPQGKGDTSAGCKCGVNGVKCHPKCNYCH
ncbi:ranBP-type and C3HC4-type zinc finger-containing protein 1-like isoform X5 [Dermacentor silvarum]|uniref:ranBP-type and C3HC4-type zinc finger-containing protein 1-like isoform X5 n=1 Tax=Dermacentor silvarum TaxID=543639 RepID=UPI0021008570|nr:ranBP-type and C3HC4-type zinc finger-containing protein 1-like isoform X5 [Dermacentor silvarum]